MRALDIAFVMVGNEILQGFTTDTNSTLLGGRLTQMGHRIRSITVVGDDVKDIISSLRHRLRSGVDLVFVCGGLGGTPDDVTIDAVSKALHLPLIRSRTAHSWIAEKAVWGHLKDRIPEPALTEAHLKMSLVPKGSKVLFNQQGIAPGLIITVKGKTRTQKVIVLPGVPRELKDIFKEQIEGSYIKPTTSPPFFEEIVVQIPESTMEPLLKRMHDEVPKVTIGSYPQDDRKVILRVYGKKELVKGTVKVLRKELKRLDNLK